MSDALDWDVFFPGDAQGGIVQFRILRRGGEPFLFLPPSPRCAAECLDIYPAQTRRALFLRAVLRVGLRLRLPVVREKITLPWPASAPLAGFISASPAPVIAMLAGNPRAAGQRFLFVVLEEGAPSRVVKAGVSPKACELIRAETAFLKGLPAGFPASPSIEGSLQKPGLCAFKQRFIPGGTPPLAGADEAIAGVLTAWLDQMRYLLLATSPAWQRVRGSSADANLVERVVGAFGSAPFRPAVMHGDFAPWNIRVRNGAWTALDWERGEYDGIPGWDWFHYVIQSLVLVHRASAAAVLEKIFALLGSPRFRAFAQAAGIAGRERAALLAYLIHANFVVRQVDGAETLRDLLKVVASEM